jgi:proline racemase
MRLARMITAVDTHACGEPGRVITGGVLDVPGRTMFEKKVYLETQGDGLRKLMLSEPRCYPSCCGRVSGASGLGLSRRSPPAG